MSTHKTARNILTSSIEKYCCTQPNQHDCLLEQYHEQEHHKQQQDDGEHDGGSVQLQHHEGLDGAWCLECREEHDDGGRQPCRRLVQRHLPHHAQSQLLLLEVHHFTIFNLLSSQ